MQRDVTRDALGDFIFEGEEGKARIATGGLRVYEQLLGLFIPPRPRAEEVEEPFVDPGTIPPPPERP